MSLNLAAPVSTITTNTLSYSFNGINQAGPLYTSVTGDVVPATLNRGILAFAPYERMPTFKHTTLGYLIGRVEHTLSTAANYNITVPDAELYPFLSFICHLTKITSAATAVGTLYCGYNNGTIDSGENYRRRIIYHNGTAVTTTSNDATVGIISGYLYSNTTSNVTQSCFIQGNAYVRSGAQRIFTQKYQWSSTTSVSSVAIDATNWSNTADVLTNIQFSVPANTYATFRLYQRCY